MKGQSLWSYAPYRPFLYPSGDIYVCRVAPTIDSITLDWLDIGDKQYEVYGRSHQQERTPLLRARDNIPRIAYHRCRANRA